MNIDYPQYRRLSNFRSYYRITGPSFAEEIQVMGSSYMIHNIEAKILPERLLIQDMISGQDGVYIPVSSDEYEEFVAGCRSKLRQIM